MKQEQIITLVITAAGCLLCALSLVFPLMGVLCVGAIAVAVVCEERNDR